jgi:uncharacterized membrane protein
MQEADRPDGNSTEGGAIRIERVSHAFFASVLIGLGILGLVKGDFAPGWQPVPESMPGRQALAYLCSAVCLACGVGLLFRRTAAIAARVLFVWLLLWLLLLRVPWMLVSFQVGTWWAASSTALITATAWILYISLANDWDRQRFGFATGDKGLRIARILFGLGLIPIGLAHFLYLEATATVVPAWMQWPVFWSYFTGGAFIAAGIAIIAGVLARLAAVLVTVQIGLLTLLVWLPRVVTGNLNAFQWGEVVVSVLLTACAWVVADSYRGTPWLAFGRR